MSKRLFLLVVLLVICAVAGYSLLQKTPAGKESLPEPSEDQLELLRALPYTHWSENASTRSLSGVTDYDPALASTGFNLYTNDVNEVYLMDMEGRKVHTWTLNGRNQCDSAELLDQGDLLVICAPQALVRLNWDSEVLWELTFRAHHDAGILGDGTFLVLSNELKSYNSYRVFFDEIIHVSALGEPLGRWSSYDELQKIRRYHEPSPLDRPSNKPDPQMNYEYYHANRIQVLPDTPAGRKDSRFRTGNVLICLRNANLLAILDSATKEIVWHWGPGVLDLPHSPTMLPEGTILMFDNGTRRGYSRVLEIDPLTGHTVWEYKGSPEKDFFSAFRGFAQRLPNGNTLICDSESGRVFEVTREKKVVWNYWNPEQDGDKRKNIYRMIRIPDATIMPLLQRYGDS